MSKKKGTKRFYALLLTLVMGMTLMLSSVTTFAATETGNDSLVSSVVISGTTASYSFNTVGTDTKYYFDGILPSTANLSSVTVRVTLRNAGIANFNGTESLENKIHIFNSVNLNSGKTLTVTSGTVTREYRICAVKEGNVNVKFAIRTDQAEAYGLVAVARKIRVPQNDTTGYLEFALPAGSSVMDALVYVTQDTNNAFGSYYAAINPYTPSDNYISKMMSGSDSLGEFDCGSMSGWMYWVNGDLPMVGAGNYLLNDNAIIDWKYIQNYSTVW